MLPGRRKLLFSRHKMEIVTFRNFLKQKVQIAECSCQFEDSRFILFCHSSILWTNLVFCLPMNNKSRAVGEIADASEGTQNPVGASLRIP